MAESMLTPHANECICTLCPEMQFLSNRAYRLHCLEHLFRGGSATHAPRPEKVEDVEIREHRVQKPREKLAPGKNP